MKLLIKTIEIRARICYNNHVIWALFHFQGKKPIMAKNRPVKTKASDTAVALSLPPPKRIRHTAGFVYIKGTG